MTSPFRGRPSSPPTRSRPTSPSVRNAFQRALPSRNKPRGNSPTLPSWQRITSSGCESPSLGNRGLRCQKDANVAGVYENIRHGASQQVRHLTNSQGVDDAGALNVEPMVPTLDLPVFVASLQSSTGVDSNAGWGDRLADESADSIIPRVPTLDLPVFKASFPSLKSVDPPVQPWSLQLNDRHLHRSGSKEKLKEDSQYAGKSQWPNRMSMLHRNDHEETRRAGRSPSRRSPSRADADLVASALASGLPTSYARQTEDKQGTALRVLEATRRQREYQEALLHQAQKQLMSAAKSEHDKAMKEAALRIGGPEHPNATFLNTSKRTQHRLTLAVVADTQVNDSDGVCAPPARGSKSPARARQSPRTHQARDPGAPTPRWAHDGSTPATTTRRQRSQSPWSHVKARFDQKPASDANGSSPYPSSSLNSSVSSVTASPLMSSPSPKSPSTNPRRLRLWSGHSSPPRSPRIVQTGGGVERAELTTEESVVDALLERNLLSSEPRAWDKDPDGVTPDDLAHVRAMFSAQMPNSCVLRVLRLENNNSGLCGVYEAVRRTTSVANERSLWHGTSFDCVRNIALSGFNRAYCGRHGTKLGFGTYFSQSAEYSVRFCDRKQKRRVVILADVIVGSWTKGTPDLVEPPHMDTDCLSRYDSTVDDVDNPSIFCVFRDFQALPRYLVEFTVIPKEA